VKLELLVRSAEDHGDGLSLTDAEHPAECFHRDLRRGRRSGLRSKFQGGFCSDAKRLTRPWCLRDAGASWTPLRRCAPMVAPQCPGDRLVLVQV